MIIPMELGSFSNLRFLNRKSASEWSSECPKCGTTGHNPRTGEPDRFHIHLDGRPRGSCRRCGYFAFADSLDNKPEPVVLPISQAPASRSVEERLDKLPVMVHEYHYHPKAKKQWETQGLCEQFDRYMLGYTPSKTIVTKAKNKLDIPALTIPVVDLYGEIVNIRYRLMGELPEGVGRYRGEYGVPVSLFIGDYTPGNPLLLLEGEKKAIRVASEAGGAYSVVAVPGKENYGLVSQLIKFSFSSIIVALDPDASISDMSDGEPPVIRIARRLAKFSDNIFVASLTDKIDDMLDYLSWSQVDSVFLNGARRYRGTEIN